MFEGLLRLALVAIMLVGTSSARAQVLFVDDFQDGDLNGWRTGGRGNVQVTSYGTNRSLQLTRASYASIGLQLTDTPRVRISLSFAALDLEGNDACVAETSVDGGETWNEFHRIEDGSDDSLTLYPGATETDVSADTPLLLRIRINGNGDNDTCWVDNVQISAVTRRDLISVGPRQKLTANFLRSGEALSRPVAMREFGPIDPEQSSPSAFEGRLSFSVARGAGTYAPLRDRFGFAASSLARLGYPPSFSVDLVSDGELLIPHTRALQVTDHAAWDLILSAGRIWRERADGDALRAAIPFALQEKNANCTHNGIITFLIRNGVPASRAAYQISSETCAYHQFDMWGMGTISRISEQVDDKDGIIAGYRQERRRRLPTKPLSELGQDHPTLDTDAFGSPQDISPDHLTTFGVVVDGVHYQSPCFTRYGDYPFCEEMALPSYSTSKSIFAGLGLMRLEQLYPGSSDEMIADHVSACRRAGWSGITFDHALNMATGRYKKKMPDADESAAVRDGFFLSPLHKVKIERACEVYPRRERPGRTFVYHTSDHYVLGAAMRAFLAQKTASDADIHRTLVVEPLDQLLGLSDTATATRRTADDRAQPYVGWGLTFLSDDIAKIGSSLSGTSASTGMQQLFGREALATALQQNPDDRGLPAPAKPIGYSNGFWAYDVASALSCQSPQPIPFMSGYGGISVVPMPNGLTYYYFSDNEEFSWVRAVAAADHFRPICKVR
ncbi:MAG: serine hydrolase [Pseudomonadota bacterium]